MFDFEDAHGAMKTYCASERGSFLVHQLVCALPVVMECLPALLIVRTQADSHCMAFEGTILEALIMWQACSASTRTG